MFCVSSLQCYSVIVALSDRSHIFSKTESKYISGEDGCVKYALSFRNTRPSTIPVYD